MGDPIDETETCWHLLITTGGGRVSILQNLDAPTARQAYQRLLPHNAPVEYINVPDAPAITMRPMRAIGDGDIWLVDILGPQGVDLDPWKGVAPRVVDLSIL